LSRITIRKLPLRNSKIEKIQKENPLRFGIVEETITMLIIKYLYIIKKENVVNLDNVSRKVATTVKQKQFPLKF